MSETPIKDRVVALADTLLDGNDTIPAAFMPIVKKLLAGFLEKSGEDQIKTMLVKVRDQIIPFMLTGEVVPDDPNPDKE